MVCPEGKELIYESSSLYKETKLYEKRYRCTHYKECSVRWLCSKNKTGRKVKLTPYVDVVKRQRQKHEIEDNVNLLQKRKEIIEPVFGWIKHLDNFKRFTVKGLKNVKLQWSLICATVNLRTIFKHWTTGSLKNVNLCIETLSKNFFKKLFPCLLTTRLIYTKTVGF